LSWCYDRRSVGLSVLMSGTPLGYMNRSLFFPSFAGQLLCSSSWGVLSDERTCLQFAVQSVSGQSCGGLITIHYCLIWDYWVPFPSPLTTRKNYLKVEVEVEVTVGQSVCLGVGHPFGAHDQILHFPFFCRKIVLLFVLGLRLWCEDLSAICSAICRWSEPRRTHNHALLSHLRLLGSLSVASCDSKGLRWKYTGLWDLKLS
jgi:hypothetical protein